jgi:ribosomal protein S18 acetylase RimI-like enzyme
MGVAGHQIALPLSYPVSPSEAREPDSESRASIMREITVRTATVADLETIAANNSAMALETEGRRLDPQTIRSGVRHALADSTRGVYYLAERDGRVIGQLLITREWSDWRDGWFWWIQNVYVAPNARRQGVYRAMYEHVKTEARRQPNVCGLRLYVEGDNEQARRVYEHLGMKRSAYRLYEADWGREGRE